MVGCAVPFPRRRVFLGESGKDLRVRKRRTFSGALCSENQDVPGSSSSFTSASGLESASASVDVVSLSLCASVSLVLSRWALVRA